MYFKRWNTHGYFKGMKRIKKRRQSSWGTNKINWRNICSWIRRFMRISWKRWGNWAFYLLQLLAKFWNNTPIIKKIPNSLYIRKMLRNISIQKLSSMKILKITLKNAAFSSLLTEKITPLPHKFERKLLKELSPLFWIPAVNAILNYLPKEKAWKFSSPISF